MLFLLALALSPSPRRLSEHDLAHSHGNLLCGCESGEDDHPFTIDCSNAQAIRDATLLLEGATCDEGRSDDFEWGGSFNTPDNSYKWVSQAVGGAYADPEMKMVMFALDHADTEDLFAKRDQANTLLAGSCPVVNTGGTIAAPTAAGSCVTLTFPTDPSVDFVATVDTTGVTYTAFFTAHVPTEFERDIHYLMQDVSDLTTATPNEPVAQSEEYCKVQVNSDGLKQCQQAFFILQAHHDYCSHDTLTRYEEELVHEWESKCYKCAIERQYDATLKDCPQIDCSDNSVVDASYYVLAGNHSGKCTPADFSVAFEWGGVFDTPDTSYKWVSQAVGGAYADPEMKMAMFSMSQTNMGTLFSQQELADALMDSGPCPVVNTGDTLPVPTTAGVCVTLTFPTNASVDFVVTVDTTGVAHTAFFTAHVPTEFERDIHYLMQDVSDLTTATPNEPLNEVPSGGGGHEHRLRRRLTASHKAAARAWARGPKRSRRLADSGSCCNTVPQQGAWKQIVAYHDLCAHDDVPTYVEVGFHDYEASCEDYFCNAVPAGYDGTLCPSPPSPPTPPPPAVSDGDDLDTGALIGIIAAGVVALIAITLMICMISKERAGQPIFAKIEDIKKPAASA